MKAATKKIGLELDSRLYARLDKLAEDHGQSKTFLLQQAVKHYLDVVVPSQSTIRPEVMAHFRRSKEKNRKLMGLLAK
jgi:predicted transcriptional regulator